MGSLPMVKKKGRMKITFTMLKKLRKLGLLIGFMATCVCVHAQGDVIIMGTVENPVSNNVTIHYKKNLFTLS